MKNLIFATLIALSIVLTGCEVKPKQINITGKILISTKGGTSYKLGSVKVDVVRASDISKSLQTYADQLKQLDADMREVARKAFLAPRSEISRSPFESLYPSTPGLTSVEKEVAMFAVKKAVEFTANEEKIFETPSVMTTSTDADGAFQFVIDTPGKYVIIAQDTRVASASNLEEYFWFIKVDNKPNQHIVMNNINMTELFNDDNNEVVSVLENMIRDFNK